VVLSKPPYNKQSVIVKNDVDSPVIELGSSPDEIDQSAGILRMKVLRKKQMKGRVVVPWGIRAEKPESIYSEFKGEVTLGENQDEAVVDVKLPTVPLETREETITFVLMEPQGFRAQLGDDTECDVRVRHNLGEGVVSMAVEEMTCSGLEGEAVVVIRRAPDCFFPAQVSWIAQDKNAEFGKHYHESEGTLLLESGKKEGKIVIPVVNDPCGDERSFKVIITGVEGRDTAGENLNCKVNISSNATIPGPAMDVTAELKTKTSALVTWTRPKSGGNVDGYKVEIGGRVETVPADATSVEIDDLKPDSTLSVSVHSFNSVGDGVTSNIATVITPKEEGIIGFAESEVQVKQSDEVLVLKVLREEFTRGKVIIPWSTESSNPALHDIKGVEHFNGGDDDTHIEIQLPKQPQDDDFAQFTVVLGEPTGAAVLSESDRCLVNVANDVMYGVIGFPRKVRIKANQTDKSINIPVSRSGSTDGEVEVKWSTSCAETSPYFNLSGVETFEDGDGVSHIKIDLPDLPQSQEVDNFTIVLHPVKGDLCKLGAIAERPVEITNDIESPTIDLEFDADDEIDQTEGIVKFKIKRRNQTKGKFVIPWRLKQQQSIDSMYNFMKGEIPMEDGEDEAELEIKIPQVPLPADKETVELELQPPTDFPTKFTSTSHLFIINNNIGLGVIEMDDDKMICDGEDGEVGVLVRRRDGNSFETSINWSATKPSSLMQQLVIEQGVLSFNPGETTKKIMIPVENDPSGQQHQLNVSLDDVVEGRDSIGSLKQCVVTIRSEAVYPDPVRNLTAELITKSSANIEWTAPEKMEYVTGYTLYIIHGDSSKTVSVPADTTEVTVDDLTPGVDYDFKVVPFNDQGESKEKKKASVKTPEEIGNIGFVDTVVNVKQTDDEIEFKLLRSVGSHGKVIVPWTVQSDDDTSPYKGMSGQETFKDGETESTIQISIPSSPRESETDNFNIVLGYPTGGAGLSEDATTCNVSVANNVPFSVISFIKEQVQVAQSSEELEIPVQRAQNMTGKVKVQWHTSNAADGSPFENQSGVETFEQDENLSHIKLSIPQAPRDGDDEFDIVLQKPKESFAKLGEHSVCNVSVQNDIEPALINFGGYEPSSPSQRDDGKLQVTVGRSQNSSGKLTVPWKVIPHNPDSVYVGIKGEVTFGDGDTEKEFTVNIPQVPLSEPIEEITIALDQPTGVPAKLGESSVFSVQIKHDLGTGSIAMKADDVSCDAKKDREAQVVVKRTGGDNFHSKVGWYVVPKGGATMGEHYFAEKGELDFKPGVKEVSIIIPVKNDPTTSSHHLQVCLDDQQMEGRDHLGESTVCHVTIENDSRAPKTIKDIQIVTTTTTGSTFHWKRPVDEMPLDGYKATYYCDGEPPKTIALSPQNTELSLPDLKPDTKYYVSLIAFNVVGEADPYEFVIETQPAFGEIGFHAPTASYTLKDKKAVVKVVRQNGHHGRSVVPWYIKNESSAVYQVYIITSYLIKYSFSTQ